MLSIEKENYEDMFKKIANLIKNRKKGGALAKVITIIAVVSIVAAVAIPVTITLIEKGPADAEKEAINIKPQIEDIIKNNFDVTSQKDGYKFVDALNARTDISVDTAKKIGRIQFNVSVDKDGKYNVSWKIVGVDWAGRSDVTGELKNVTADRIFAGYDAPPLVYQKDKENKAEYIYKFNSVDDANVWELKDSQK